MMYATKIKMCTGCNESYNCQDIDSIYIEGTDPASFYTKGILYDFLKKNPDSIKVKLGTKPSLLPALSLKSEKYVRSQPNDTVLDNLLNLPRV